MKNIHKGVQAKPVNLVWIEQQAKIVYYFFFIQFSPAEIKASINIYNTNSVHFFSKFYMDMLLTYKANGLENKPQNHRDILSKRIRLND